jgi:ERCC4-type nuclease
MLVAPTEFQLKDMGVVSSVPEKWGCDIVMRTDKLWVGIQRKELKDLIASVQDGRLAKEVMQMSACNRLHIKVLLVEGKAQWTTDGVFMSNGFGASWTLAKHRSILWSARLEGLWVDYTDSIVETRIWLRMMEQWAGKAKHNALSRRPGALGVWGRPDSREWGIHTLQSFPGIGPETAASIYDHFGTLPLVWNVTEAQLLKVKGVGKKRAREIWGSLNNVGSMTAT